jgi:CBS domain-containing protein
LIDHSESFPIFSPSTPAKQVAQATGRSRARDIYPVIDHDGTLVGVITAEDLRVLVSDPEIIPLTQASDLMRSPTAVHPEDDVRAALDAMVAMGAREVPVTDQEGHFLGFVDEATIAHAYLQVHRTNSNSERPAERTAE